MRHRLLLMLAVAFPFAGFARAQSRLIAYVPTAEASTSGVLATAGDKSMLGERSVVTTLERPAHVTLSRGGALLVCQTSVVHLTVARMVFNSKSRENFDPLLIALESGGLELQMPALPNDAIATAGMRLASAGNQNKSTPLDLALHVAQNGDTCVENRARKSSLTLTDAFGQSTYLLKPGQHVVFQHGLVQEALPGDPSSCGCPPPPPPGTSLADAALRAGAGEAPTFNQNASAYPFPAADSQGVESLGPPPPEATVQVAANLAFNAGVPEPSVFELDPAPHTPAPLLPPEPAPITTASALDAALAPPENRNPAQPVAPSSRRKLVIPPATQPAASSAVAAAQTHPAQAPPHRAGQPPDQGGLHSVGRFFKKIFGR
jgi:hypothetical protein